MNLRDAAQAALESKIGEYWDIAYDEGRYRISRGDRANRKLAEINEAIRDLLAADKPATNMLRLLELAEVEMRYAGWPDKQADNPGRLEVYQRVVLALHNLRNPIAADKPAEWVGLTDDEINDCFEEVMFSPTNSPASRELIGKAIEAALRAKNAKPAEQDIEEMVSRFLRWKLPADFTPDGGIKFESGNNDWPIGTNLLTATQARKMLEFVTNIYHGKGITDEQVNTMTAKLKESFPAEQTMQKVEFKETPVDVDKPFVPAEQTAQSERLETLISANERLMEIQQRRLRREEEIAAEQTAQPVAWGMLSRGVIVDAICPAEHDKEEGDYTIPLYTHPAPIGNLSDEEIFAVENAVPDEVIGDRAWTLHFARAILEAARGKK